MDLYEPVAYWLERGERYEREFPGGPPFALQEARLMDVLHRLSFDSVLDVGCGFGRIGRLIVEDFPEVAYTGIDISPEQLESARGHIPTGTFVDSSLLDYDGPGADLVLAVEVLMHQPPADAPAWVEKLRNLANRYVVTVDWSEANDLDRRGNFVHDYTGLGFTPLETVGRQRIHLMEHRWKP